MRLGLFCFTTADSVNIGTLAEVAEEAGFESIWVPEHTHIPVDPGVGLPLGGPLPRSYSRLMDPLISLATAAASTERLRLGTAVTLTAAHDPIILAKQIATVDQLSQGRLTLGVGSGWNRAELAHHGVDFDTRWSRAREHLDAMRAIWSQDEASFTGRWVNFGPIWSWPKPVQQPSPPILFGTINPSPLVVKHADGWLPLSVAHPGQLTERVATMRTMAAEAGRDPDCLDITVIYLEKVTAQELREFAHAGATRLVVRPPVDSLEDYRAFLALYSELVVPS